MSDLIEARLNIIERALLRLRPNLVYQLAGLSRRLADVEERVNRILEREGVTFDPLPTGLGGRGGTSRPFLFPGNPDPPK